MESKYKKIAVDVFTSAQNGINALKDSLDQNFDQLVDTIFSLAGKVIISGMGKSGHIAKKISATLSSTGTPSFFVHPGEASHGDLGMITKNDIVILLSNSGETPELKDIVNYTRRFKIPLACMVKNSNSSLAQSSDIMIIIPDIDEALGFDAPTTSSTMMLVLGDAIAMSLVQKRGFSRNDFKIFHPGGRLGANFSKVRDLMHVSEELPLASKDDYLNNVLPVMTNQKFGCLLIVNENMMLEGIVTDGLVRRNLSSDLPSKKIHEIMAKNPIAIGPDSLAVEALEIMNTNLITSLPVIDFKTNKLLGIIHIHDCLRSGASPAIK